MSWWMVVQVEAHGDAGDEEDVVMEVKCTTEAEARRRAQALCDAPGQLRSLLKTVDHLAHVAESVDHGSLTDALRDLKFEAERIRLQGVVSS